MMPLTDKEFTAIREFVYSYAGINLTEQKKALVIGRLQKLVLKNDFDNFTDYLDWVKNQGGAAAVEEMINRISTNHTFFFREKAHFDFLSTTALKDVEELMAKQRTRDLRLWCAAAATGEEPYTLAMLLRDHFGPEYGKLDAGLLATDISTSALATAHAGVFSDDRVSLVPAKLKARFLKNIGPDQWAVSPELKKDILYRRFNLMTERWPFKGRFHIIFCRNVMIYFDQKTRNELTAKFHHFLHPGGYFFIGHSETLGRENTPFEYVMPAVYRRRK
ncbi:MAG: protein-glutamate O-methyltransferase CheR [Proteobacteria bacterium]|nr:protein-glutamate O-methyltransferase CheR [Pseudomonadota bacterium]